MTHGTWFDPELMITLCEFYMLSDFENVPPYLLPSSPRTWNWLLDPPEDN